MIVPNLEYHQGVCAWLDGKDAFVCPYDIIGEPYKHYDWLDGWDYANYNYGVLNYGKVQKG